MSAKRNIRTGILIARLLSTLAICAVSYPVSSEAQAYLGAKELRELIVGNTIHSQGLPRGHATKAFVDPSGKFLFEISGSIINGTWKIKEDGAFCVTIAGETCSRVQNVADGTYTRFLDGIPRARWLKVTPGNALSIAGPPGETVSFQSLTFSVASSFVIPLPKEGTEVTVSGFLDLPERTDPAPAVILLHGCAGISGAESGWATTLKGLGIATFTVDSFRGRAITETCSRTESLHPAGAMTDAYSALELLAVNPRIDRTRIAIMGFSIGGQTALRASQVRFQERFAKGSTRFAAHLAFYPAGCIIRLADEERTGDAPIRIFHGAADDWTLVGPCKAYVERLREAGKDATLIEYADAHHSFDNPAIPLRTLPSVVNPRNCTFVEESGMLVDAATRGSISFSPCGSRGASVGYNADAHHKAMKDVEAFLRPKFGLK
jgi:dienelactone hydrolase